MAVQATNYDGTREYEVAEVKDVYRPNLLINGDFQCNQRGQADYNITAGWKYTLDMWKAYNLYLNTKNKGVISISVPTSSIGYFVQHLDETKNGDFTFVVNVPLIHRGTISVYLEGAGTEKFTISKSGIHTHTFKNVTGATKLSMELNNFYGDFKYIDLFEGDVAYPHVKEDYTLALERCQRYIYRNKDLTHFKYYTQQGYDYFRSEILNDVKQKMLVDGKIPTVIGSQTAILAFVGRVNVLEGYTEFTMVPSSLNTVKSELLSRDILITCEPL